MSFFLSCLDNTSRRGTCITISDDSSDDDTIRPNVHVVVKDEDDDDDDDDEVRILEVAFI